MLGFSKINTLLRTGLSTTNILIFQRAQLWVFYWGRFLFWYYTISIFWVVFFYKILKTFQRITHINDRNEFKSMNINMGLIPCNPLKNDKGCEAVATMLTSLIETLDLAQYYNQFTFTSDYLITNSIEKHMKEKGTE